MPKKVSKDSKSKVTLKIPRNLYNHVQEIIKDSGFDSVTDFTVYVLRDLVSEGAPKKGLIRSHDHESLTDEEIEAVRRRLKSLGYF